jgi:hypothetical protein
MTTHERLTALERSQIDTNHNITILTGVIGEQGRDIKRMLAVLEQHTSLLMQHGEILQQHSQMLQEILNRLPPAKE